MVETVTLVDAHHNVNPTGNLEAIDEAQMDKMSRDARAELCFYRNWYHRGLEYHLDECYSALHRANPDDDLKRPELKFEIWMGRPEGAITVGREEREKEGRGAKAWRKVKRFLRKIVCR